jgi:hypothetical protein
VLGQIFPGEWPIWPEGHGEFVQCKVRISSGQDQGCCACPPAQDPRLSL